MELLGAACTAAKVMISKNERSNATTTPRENLSIDPSPYFLVVLTVKELLIILNNSKIGFSSR